MGESCPRTHHIQDSGSCTQVGQGPRQTVLPNCMQEAEGAHVQDAETADLRTFSRDKHGYIVFDNVNNMDFVLSQRAIFQSNNDIHTVGESKTGIYSYHVWLYQVPLVFTVDLSARWNKDEPWMRENHIEINLLGPCYL